MDWVIRDNYTMPVNGTLQDPINSFYFYQTEQLTLLSLLMAAIVLGNCSVLLALLLSKGRKSRMNFFIMHLAFADLSVGMISVLTDIVWRVTVAWKAGNAMCKLVRFMQAMVTYSSTYVLVALSLDRLDAITRPMNFSRSWTRARMLVASAWALSAVFASPILLLYEEKLVQGSLQCWIELGSELQWQLYMCLVALSLFIIPALIIAGCYTIIVFTIWRKSVRLAPHHQTLPLKDGDKHEEVGDVRRASSRGIIPKAKIKTVKMTFVIVFALISCSTYSRCLDMCLGLRPTLLLQLSSKAWHHLTQQPILSSIAFSQPELAPPWGKCHPSHGCAAAWFLEGRTQVSWTLSPQH